VKSLIPISLFIGQLTTKVLGHRTNKYVCVGERREMNHPTDSLHGVVDKWLGAAAMFPARIVRERDGERRCVRIEVMRAASVLSMRFFRHGDGSWMVFPPERRRPCMGGRA
jgi:hypothetical protein